jgi:predicted membrane protein (TIGR00267 family)
MVDHEHVLNEEMPDGIGSKLRELILGGQDGLVNVLGIVLGVAAATASTNMVIISGLAATIAESISMGAVAYTSTKAAKEYYLSLRKKEIHEMKTIPKQEKKEVKDIYFHKGFRGKLLNAVVEKITSSRKVWLETMLAEELRMFPEEFHSPMKSGIVVGLASIVGSLIPLIPFFFLPVETAVILSLIICTLSLFVVGSIKAKVTIGTWWKAGIELALIGMAAALCSYGVGYLLKVSGF